jgi:hypothetical protein
MRELPAFIVEVGANYAVVRVDSDWDGIREVKITRDDLNAYFAGDAHDLSSGIRRLGPVVGDWRPIDNLAHILNEVIPA